jgi:putative SOS response-associated peptidase YedK
MSRFADEGARPAGLQLVFRRHPETGLAVEGRLRWGLIPHYAEARPDLQPIHARAETIAEKKIFREAYRKRRCIVPMNSFFQKDPGGKRYAISRRGGEVFGVAGIWENWRDPFTSTWERTFAVITVPANALIAPIHDRMLAILPNDQFARWLSAEEDPRDLLVPFPAEHLVVAAQRRRS